jgi:hypothetical protein
MENAGDADITDRIQPVSSTGLRVVEHKGMGSPAPRFCPAGLWLQSLGVGLIFEACIPIGIAFAEASAECWTRLSIRALQRQPALCSALLGVACHPISSRRRRLLPASGPRFRYRPVTSSESERLAGEAVTKFHLGIRVERPRFCCGFRHRHLIHRQNLFANK